jgi:hypothetical protein
VSHDTNAPEAKAFTHERSNVKHQRARATASRVKYELSLRALRCMRQLGAVAWTKAQLRHDELGGKEQTDDMRAWSEE